MLTDEVFNSEFYSKLNKIRLHMDIRLTEGLSGSRKSSAKGSSLEFSDFREYLLGDDIRHIDWNAYGRTGKLLLKLFLEEKEGRFHIFVDGSRSMDFGEARKSVQSLRIAGAMAYVALSNLDRVFLTTVSEKELVTSKGLTGKQALDKILRQLRETDFTGTEGVAEMVYAARFKARGVAVLISDFFLEQDAESLFRYLAYHRQQILLLHVLSPEEQAPQLEGTLNLLDSERDHKLKVTMDTQVERAYHQAYETFTGRLFELCKKYGASYVFAPSDMPIDQLFYRAFGKAYR